LFPSHDHNGYIYQATNWIYTGLSDKRTEWKEKNSNLHSKSVCDKYTTDFMKFNDNFEMIERSRKHRYIYFIGSKKDKKYFLKQLNYKIQDYPKGQNKRYDASYNPNVQGILF
jgi:alpha-galactosidase/6-phospho-beta-glucosidase family protein